MDGDSNPLISVGDPGSSSLMAACSIVVNKPLFFGLKFKIGTAGGGDFWFNCKKDENIL